MNIINQNIMRNWPQNMKKKFKNYKDSKFPKITSISGEVHLFPKESRLEFSGSYILKNKTENSIDTIHSNFNARFPYEKYSWSVDNKLVVRDSIFGWDTYVFDHPILPGDEIIFTFSGAR